MTTLQRTAIALAILVVVLVGAYYKGYLDGYASGVSATEAKWAEEKARIEKKAREEADALREKTDELQAKLTEAEANIKIKTVETIRYIVKYASPKRVALQADLTEVLNRNMQIRETVVRPQGAEPAQTYPEGSGTSERAMAEWAAKAIEENDRTIVRYRALVEWICSLPGLRYKPAACTPTTPNP